MSGMPADMSMNSKIQEMEIRETEKFALSRFLNEIRREIGESIDSVILYGSVAKNNYFPGSSDINILILVREFTPEILKKASPFLKRYKRNANLSVFLADHDDIRNAADVFPIMYQDMKDHHIPLVGIDILKDLEIDSTNMRIDIERQLRELEMDLRKEYAQSNYTASEIRNMLISGFSRLAPLMRAMLKIKTGSSPVTKEEITGRIGIDYDLDTGVFEELISLKKGGNNPLKAEMEKIFDNFLITLGKMVELADKLEL